MSVAAASPAERDIVTTFHWPLREAWRRRALTIDPDQLSTPRVIARVARLSGAARAVVLDGSVGPSALYRDLLAAAAIARRRRPPAVVVADCTWNLSTSMFDRLACRTGIRAIDGPHVTYCVLSTAEQGMFPETWGVDPERVVVTLWPFTVPDEQVAEPAPDDGSVFAGGNSIRDYDSLLSVAGALPAQITIASTSLTAAQISAAPDNVRAGGLPHDDFVERLRRASVVVVPMQGGVRRGSGQTTYVNAMALGKLVVVSDVPGVADQIEHGLTGLVVPPGDRSALAEAIHWALDPANHDAVAAIRARARRVALERFSPDRYVARILEVVDATVARLDRGAGRRSS